MSFPSSSSAPRVKKAILEHLTAEAGMKGVQVAYAHPGSAIQQEAVYFHRTIENEAPASLGQLRKTEEYSLDLIVDVVQDGDDAQAAEERCWELVAVVEQYVRANPGIPSATEPSGTVNCWVLFAAAEMTPSIEEGQRLAEAVCRINVVNRK